MKQAAWTTFASTETRLGRRRSVTRRGSRPARLALAPALVVAALATPALGQATNRASVSAIGVQGNEQSLSPSISADGRLVCFVSLASNLVVGDTNGFLDVFVRDVESGLTELASVDSGGAQGNQHSGGYRPAISADGRFVVFGSSASNLVASDTNFATDAFVHDRSTGATERVSVSSAGAQGTGGSGSYGVAVSADGRCVAFVSIAANLVAGDTNGLNDVFVRDRLSSTTERVSVSSAGAQGDHTSGLNDLAISSDGRFVAFGSYASNLAPGGAGLVHHVFVRDRLTATTVRASVDSMGAAANADSGFNGISLSADGRLVAFESIATNLAAGAGPGNVYVRDLVAGSTAVVSVDWALAQPVGSCTAPALSPDGRYIAFVSFSANVVAGDTNSRNDVFVRDLMNGTNERVSVTSTGLEANNDSGQNGVALSADGRFAVFASSATNLVAGDTNSTYDVFRRDRGLLFPGTYCTAGVTSNGCTPSIAGAGVPSASSGAGFTLATSSVEGQKQGLVFYGVDNSAFAPFPWGASSSYMCVKSPTQRTGAQNSGGAANVCNGVLALDWNAYIAAHPGALGQPFAAGRHVFAQAWFRDPPSPKSTMLSDALEFVVGP